MQDRSLTWVRQADMHRKLLLTAALSLGVFAGRPAVANDYSLSTNLVIRGYVPWPIALFLIDWTMRDGQERCLSIRAMVRYSKNFALARHLKKYGESPDPAERIASFWPLYKNGQNELALSILRKDYPANQRMASAIFYLHIEVGTAYKIELSRHDEGLALFAEQVARNKTADPFARLRASTHLIAIGRKTVAIESTRSILASIGPKDHHLRVWAEHSLELAGEMAEKK